MTDHIGKDAVMAAARLIVDGLGEGARTPAGPPQRFRQAVSIVDPGACNPSGVAWAIVEACREVQAEGRGGTRDDPAVWLMTTQLAHLCNADSDCADWADLVAECRRRVEGAS